MGHPMRIELTRAGLLVYLANHYTTQGAPVTIASDHPKNYDVACMFVFSSLSGHLVGTEQANCCSVSSLYDPGRNLSHLRKINACLVGGDA